MDDYPRRVIGNAHPRPSLELVESIMETYVKNRTTDVSVARVYDGALGVVVHHGDKVRATVFVERGYDSYLTLEGFDGEKERQMKVYLKDSTQHIRWKNKNIWRTEPKDIPTTVGNEAFEEWL